AIALLLVAVYIYKFYENAKRYPKGPTPLPFIGNLLKFRPDRLHLFLREAQQEYGDVFTIWTPAPMVVLAGYESIKQALINKGEDFNGRMGHFPDDQFMTMENGGVIFSDGDNWKTQRRTSVHILRDFGMGKNVMEEQVKSSLREFMRHLDSMDTSRVDFRWPIQILVANVINQVLFGYHFKYDDCKRLMDYSNALTTQTEIQRQNPLVFLAMQLPIITKLPLLGWLARGQYKSDVDVLHKHVREDVIECEKTFDENEEPSCFVHAYMQKMKASDGSLNRLQMLNVCNDFFLAGMETTSTTLRWTMLHLAKHQDVQNRIREEIHSVIGRDGEISMADRPQMPYTSAAVNEAQRTANILPLNIMHRTTVDTEVAGHAIPANTLVQASIYNVLANSEVFEQPDEFRPDRFLLADGKTPNKATLDPLVPFSMGKRQCAGEGLARMELFLALVMIIQKYRILPPKDAPLDITPVDGIIRMPRTNYLHLIAA
ncbi:hypothetical protein PMAYCL1PPCAC_16747, partial [Pristionchus mayeri]